MSQPRKPTNPDGRPTVYGERMTNYSVSLPENLKQMTIQNGGAALIRRLLEEHFAKEGR